MKKMNVVVIGGGHGQSVILRGLKQLKDVHLSTIVTVADDGGSTGRLRKYMHIPAVGDIRNVMIALSEEETLLTTLMDYRFNSENNEDIGGHNLGNLMLTALVQKSGDIMTAIHQLGKVLRVKGDVIPSTTQIVTLCARMDDDTIVSGESNIPKYFNNIEEIFYQEKVTATKSAIKAIKKADIIIFGIGSLYTSIIPNLIIPQLRDAINASSARKIYLCNAMTQHGETDGYSLEDHVKAIEKHLQGHLDTVVRAKDAMPHDALMRYESEYAYPVFMKQKTHRYRIVNASLLSFENGLIRHDPDKIRRVIERLIGEETCHSQPM